MSTSMLTEIARTRKSSSGKSIISSSGSSGTGIPKPKARVSKTGGPDEVVEPSGAMEDVPTIVLTEDEGGLIKLGDDCCDAALEEVCRSPLAVLVTEKPTDGVVVCEFVDDRPVDPATELSSRVPRIDVVMDRTFADEVRESVVTNVMYAVGHIVRLSVVNAITVDGA